MPRFDGLSIYSDLIKRHALLGQFPFCFLVLRQVHQAHATQHIGRLGELDIIVADDLNSITPRVPKIKEGAKAFR